MEKPPGLNGPPAAFLSLGGLENWRAGQRSLMVPLPLMPPACEDQPDALPEAVHPERTIASAPARTITIFFITFTSFRMALSKLPGRFRQCTEHATRRCGPAAALTASPADDVARTL